MTTINLSAEYINRISRMFARYRKIRKLILKNVDEYISDFVNFKGTPEEKAEYLEIKYRSKAPQENYLVVLSEESVLFNVIDIALLTGRDPSSTSRMLANLEHSEGWYSRLIPLRHKVKSANNNSIYAYDREIFDLIMDYREYMYLERIKRAGAVDFSEVMRYWNYLKKLDDYKSRNESVNAIKGSESVTENSEEPSELPEVPPVSWQDVIKVIGSKLFSVKVDMIFALAFAMTFGLARRWTGLIPVFAAVSATLLAVCAFMLRHRAARTELIAETGAVMTLLALFWGVNLTMENGIYTPGGTVMNLTSPEPALNIRSFRGEYRGLRNYPVVFFVDADNEAEIKELFYRTDLGSYQSTGKTEMGNVNFLLKPEIKGNEITFEIKYTDTEDKEHGPYKFTFDVKKERFNSGKNAVINHPDILWLIDNRNTTVINSFMNDTVKSVHYGINTDKPDRVYVPDFDEGYDGDGSYVVDIIHERVDFVSLYTEFTDGTSSDIHIKETENGRQSVPYGNESISL